MKMEIKISGEVYEDRDIFKVFMAAPELHSMVLDIKEIIRTRLKHEEISESEANFLEKLSRELYIPALDE